MGRRRTDRQAITDKADEAYRGVKYGSAYRYLLGETAMLRPGDHAGARAALAKVNHALEMESTWTGNERNRLRRMRDKWKRRASGRDPRFEVAGTKPGRLDAVLRQRQDEIAVTERIRERVNDKKG